MAKNIPFPPRGLRIELAAPYVGLGRSKFLQMVKTGELPSPVNVGRCRIWDRADLDRAFDALKGADLGKADQWEDIDV